MNRLVTTEAGGMAAFTVVLAARPTAAVSMNLISSAPDEGTVAPATATFTTSNWNVPQRFIITGVDDTLRDGDQPYEIRASAVVSTDARYDGLSPSPLFVTNADNDGAGMTVRVVQSERPHAGAQPPLPQGLITTESGDVAVLTVVLDTPPAASKVVVVDMTSSNLAEGTVSPASLTFTTDNWNAPRSVRVRGVDDAAVDSVHARQYAVVAAINATGTTDSEFLTIASVSTPAFNIDDETAGISIHPLGRLVTTEDGGSDTFTIVLDAAPTSNVTIPLEIPAAGQDEVILLRSSVTFTPYNWNAPQTVTVRGRQDAPDPALADGNQFFDLVTKPAMSADPNYANLDARDIPVENVDSAAAGVIVRPLSAPMATTESGGVARFSVTLLKQPAPGQTVVLGLISDNASEGAVSPSTVSFGQDDYNLPRTIIVTGVDDQAVDGDQPYHIVTTIQSGDASYTGLTVDDVGLVNQDNDAPRIVVVPTSSPMATREEGATAAARQATFEIRLEPPASSPVTISLRSSDELEGTVPASVMVTTSTVVTVTGVDDGVADGDRPYRIQLTPTAGPDAYKALTAPDVELVNLDNDSPGVIVSPVSGVRTTEGGGTGSFSVRLETPPKAGSSVVIGVVSSDPTEGTVTAPASGKLTFTPADWNTPQAVTIKGVADAVADGDQLYTIVTSVLDTTTDPAYAGVEVSDVTVMNTEDKTPPTNITAIAVSCAPRGGTGGLTCLPAGVGYDVLCTATATNVGGSSTNVGGSSTDVTATATFTSSSSSVAAPAKDTVTVDGKVVRPVTIIGSGTATISALQEGVASPTTGTLGTSAYLVGGEAETVTAISLPTTTVTVAVGVSAQLTATATFTSANPACATPPSRDVTRLVTWSSANTAIFANPVLGVVTGLSPGTANAVAQYGGSLSASQPVKVTGPGGGPAWTFQQPDLKGRDLTAVWGSGPDDVYVVGIQSAAYHSVDGGATWKPVSIGADQFFGIWGTSASNVYVVGGTAGAGHVYRYDGMKWATVASPDHAMFAVWGSGPNDVYAVGEGGTIQHSTDGMTFNPQASNTTANLLAIAGSGPSDVFVVGGIGGEPGFILHTGDGGATWKPQFMTSAISDSLDGVWAFAGGTAYVADLQGNALVATSNDGTDWMPGAKSPGTGGGLYGIWASGPDDIYVAGATGTGALIAHTTGVGAPLTAETLPATDVGDGFSAVWGSSADDVYAVGVNGRIAHKH